MGRNVLTLVAALVAAVVADTAGAAEGDVERLLQLHAESLEAHRRSDPEALLERVGEAFLSIDDGRVETVGHAELRAMFDGYLGSTRFEVYRDTQPPRARVSDDGSLGWVIAEVEASGVQVGPDGEERPLRFRAAWVSLFEKTDGRWTLVGNASSVVQ